MSESDLRILLFNFVIFVFLQTHRLYFIFEHVIVISESGWRSGQCGSLSMLGVVGSNPSQGFRDVHTINYYLVSTAEKVKDGLRVM